MNKKLRFSWCPALFKFLVKFHYETGPQTIFQGSSPRAALIRFSKLFRWSALMRSPGDRGATKPGKLRPSSFKASPQPSTPSRPTPSPRPSPIPHYFLENPKIVWGAGGGGGGGDPPTLKASPTLILAYHNIIRTLMDVLWPAPSIKPGHMASSDKLKSQPHLVKAVPNYSRFLLHYDTTI